MAQASTNSSDAAAAPPAVSSAPQSQPTEANSAKESSVPESKPTTVSTPSTTTTTKAPVTIATTPAATLTGNVAPLPVADSTSQTPKPQVNLPSSVKPFTTIEKPVTTANSNPSPNPANPPKPTPTVAGVKRKLSDTTSTNTNTNTNTAGNTNVNVNTSTKDPPSQQPVAVPSAVSTPSTTRPQAPPSNLTFADGPVVSKVVGDILNLLQHYGPLTLGQMEFNLPPLQGERLRSPHLSDIVDLLETCGILQKEQVWASTSGSSETGGDSNINTTNPSPPRYCVQQGHLRLFQVSPSTVMEEILQAQQEWKASQQRQEILIKALQATGPSAVHPRITLKRILSEFPDVITDPLYVTALRNLNVDLGTVLGIESPPAAGGTATKKKKKRKRPSTASTSTAATGSGGSTPATGSTPKSKQPTPAADATSTPGTTPATAPPPATSTTGSAPKPTDTTLTPKQTTTATEAKPTPIASSQTTPAPPATPTPTPAPKEETSKTATLAPPTQTLEANTPNKPSIVVADKDVPVGAKETSTPNTTTTPSNVPEGTTAETVPQENIVTGKATTKP